ncbi:MAG TPA: PEGA domain-containing protein [Myxococcales bacterium]|nr:PEGA domain-containing protein [Myxococcales bacterium]
MRSKNLAFVAAATAVFFFNSCFLVVAPAFAQDGRRVACFVLAKNKKQTEAALFMSSIVRQEMAQLVGVTLKTGAPAGNVQAGLEATRLTNVGFTALNSGDKKTALSNFKQANEVLAQNPGVGSVKLHARVAKGLGVASFMSGQTTIGRDLIKRSLLLFSRQSANDYAYSINMRTIFEHTKREISEMPQGTIEIQSTPDGAEVYLDGKFKGYTPNTISNVPAGNHLLEVVKDGYLRWSSSADVAPSGRAATEAVLTAAPFKSNLDDVQKRMVKSMKSTKRFKAATMQLLGLVDAQEALVVTASLDGAAFNLRGHYLDLSGKLHKVNATIARDASFYKSIRSFLSSNLKATFAPDERADALDSPPPETIASVMKESAELGGELAIDPDSPLFNVQQKSSRDSIINKWWFWTIIGTVAVGAVTAVVVLTTGDEDASSGAVGDLKINLQKFAQ